MKIWEKYENLRKLQKVLENCENVGKLRKYFRDNRHCSIVSGHIETLEQTVETSAVIRWPTFF